MENSGDLCIVCTSPHFSFYRSDMALTAPILLIFAVSNNYIYNYIQILCIYKCMRNWWPRCLRHTVSFLEHSSALPTELRFLRLHPHEKKGHVICWSSMIRDEKTYTLTQGSDSSYMWRVRSKDHRSQANDSLSLYATTCKELRALMHWLSLHSPMECQDQPFTCHTFILFYRVFAHFSEDRPRHNWLGLQLDWPRIPTNSWRHPWDLLPH